VVAKNRSIEVGAFEKLLARDLDWIAMKALEKERTRRYESPSALAADITRYLNDEPVSAVAPSAIRRLQKFARRNKALVTGVAAVFVVLLAGVIDTTVLYLHSERLRADAVRAREEAVEASRLAFQKQQEAELLREKAEKALALVADLSAASELIRERLSPDRRLTAQRVRALLDHGEDYRYLDVRTVAEFSEGHIPGALDIPIAHVADPELANWNMNGQFLAVVRANLPLDSPLIVGCRSGRRSAVATQLMIEAGYSRVYNFAGDANELGYPLERGDGGPDSYKSLFSKTETSSAP
jgi:rhodanese-related sulfurtransferase